MGVGKTYIILTLEDAQGKVLSTKEIVLEANLGEQSYRGQENYWANQVKMSYYTAKTTNLKVVEDEQQYYINLKNGGFYVYANEGDAGADVYSSGDTTANSSVSMSTSSEVTSVDTPYLKYKAEVVQLTDEDVKEYNYFPGLKYDNNKNCAIVEFEGLGKFYNVWLAETYHHEFIYDEENDIMSIDSASINVAGMSTTLIRKPENL